MKTTHTEADLIGTWQCSDPESGDGATITITFAEDEMLHYDFGNDGYSSKISNKWSYAKNQLTEHNMQGTLYGSLQWFTNDYFVLTIIDNGIASYRGKKRHYVRLNPEQK